LMGAVWCTRKGRWELVLAGTTGGKVRWILKRNRRSFRNKRQKHRHPPSHPVHRCRGWSEFLQKDTNEALAYEEQRVTHIAAALGIHRKANEFATENRADERWQNNLFFVTVYYLDASKGRQGRLHLDVVRRDGQAVHDWRDMQRIKNEIVGPEREALELYPAVSRLHDMCNNYHLWVSEEEELWNIGWWEGIVTSSAIAATLGSTQRDYDAGDPMRAVSLAGDKTFLATVKQEQQG
jgi:hypothetical protein